MTLNVKDLRSKMLVELGVEISSPGALVDRLLDDIPESVVLAVHQISSRWRHPPRSARQVVEVLETPPTMAKPLRRLVQLLPREAG